MVKASLGLVIDESAAHLVNKRISVIFAAAVAAAAIYGAICEQVASYTRCTLRLPNAIFILTLTLICVAAKTVRSVEGNQEVPRCLSYWDRKSIHHSSFHMQRSKGPRPSVRPSTGGTIVIVPG